MFTVAFSTHSSRSCFLATLFTNRTRPASLRARDVINLLNDPKLTARAIQNRRGRSFAREAFLPPPPPSSPRPLAPNYLAATTFVRSPDKGHGDLVFPKTIGFVPPKLQFSCINYITSIDSCMHRGTIRHHLRRSANLCVVADALTEFCVRSAPNQSPRPRPDRESSRWDLMALPSRSERRSAEELCLSV